MQPITPRRKIKGTNDIRTHLGTVGQAFKPHEIHMRLSILEMEKARRNKEKESALQRIKIIDARFNEIEQEKHDLLKALAEQAALVLPAGKEREPEGRTADTQQGTRGFKIQY